MIMETLSSIDVPWFLNIPCTCNLINLMTFLVPVIVLIYIVNFLAKEDIETEMNPIMWALFASFLFIAISELFNWYHNSISLAPGETIAYSPLIGIYVEAIQSLGYAILLGAMLVFYRRLRKI